MLVCGVCFVLCVIMLSEMCWCLFVVAWLLRVAC